MPLLPIPSTDASMPRRRPPSDVEALPPGSRVAEFEIQRLLGSGGFGVVYLAMDHTLHRRVALKEYLPVMLAGREKDGHIVVRSPAFAETFDAGLRSFVNEARMLARFDHPALVKVHRFWESNGTAYMVMPYYEGHTLKQVRKSMDEPPEQAWLERMLSGLLGALGVLHGASVYHRDIAPDNILLQPGGTPVLLDFGAARHVLTGQTQALTAMLKPTYAPIEQYAEASEFQQGPWTDIYATAATLYYLLTGKAPPTAVARMVDDEYRPLRLRRELLRPKVGQAFDADWLAALDWGLEVKPRRRPQSVEDWRRALAGGPVPPLTAMPWQMELPPGWRADGDGGELTQFPTTIASLGRARGPEDVITQAPVGPGTGGSQEVGGQVGPHVGDHVGPAAGHEAGHAHVDLDDVHVAGAPSATDRAATSIAPPPYARLRTVAARLTSALTAAAGRVRRQPAIARALDSPLGRQLATGLAVLLAVVLVGTGLQIAIGDGDGPVVDSRGIVAEPASATAAAPASSPAPDTDTTTATDDTAAPQPPEAAASGAAPPATVAEAAAPAAVPASSPIGPPLLAAEDDSPPDGTADDALPSVEASLGPNETIVITDIPVTEDLLPPSATEVFATAPPALRNDGAISPRPATAAAASTTTAGPSAPPPQRVLRPVAQSRPIDPPARTTPEQLCGKRWLLARLNCMSELCATRQWTRHPQCVEWHEIERRNRPEYR